MLFDSSNAIVQLCTQGMTLQLQNEPKRANDIFMLAWKSAANDFERFIAAHYIARNLQDPDERLKWNVDALQYAQTIEDEEMVTVYSSLYLNIAKSFEDLDNLSEAHRYYQLASDHCKHLRDDAYGRMIRSGVENGLDRMKAMNIELK